MYLKLVNIYVGPIPRDRGRGGTIQTVLGWKVYARMVITDFHQREVQSVEFLDH